MSCPGTVYGLSVGCQRAVRDLSLCCPIYVGRLSVNPQPIRGQPTIFQLSTGSQSLVRELSAGRP